MLSRLAGQRYFQGDFAQAEMLATDATEFYEELLSHSDDPELRFRAAEAYGNVAHIWLVLQKYERAGTANERAGQLLERLVSQFPKEPSYVAALATNYNRIGPGGLGGRPAACRRARASGRPGKSGPSWPSGSRISRSIGTASRTCSATSAASVT